MTTGLIVESELQYSTFVFSLEIVLTATTGQVRGGGGARPG
jgi:hypothetical protein